MSLPTAAHVLPVLGSTALLMSLTACGSSSPTATTPPTTGTSVASHTPASAPSHPASSTPSTAPPASQAPVPVESNPPGDIPDNLAFVPYANKQGGYSFLHPEGWAEKVSGSGVNFTDKLNGVDVSSLPASKAPTVASARSLDVPRLQQSVPAFELRSISAVRVPGGTGVDIVYRRNSAPDPVTGRVYRDEVQGYEIFRAGRLVRLDLYGPVGADNVDAYRTMSQSLSIR